MLTEFVPEKIITLHYAHKTTTWRATEYNLRYDGSGVLSNCNNQEELILYPNPHLLSIHIPENHDVTRHSPSS